MEKKETSPQILTNQAKPTPVRLGFMTCTVMEAVEEINLALKENGYADITVSEDDLVFTGDVEDNDFGDSYFLFQTEIADTVENIKEKFFGTAVDMEFADEFIN